MTPTARIVIPLLLAIVVALLLSGCGTAGYVSCMHEFTEDPDMVGQNPLCTIEVKKQLSDRVAVKYFHQSWLSSGAPFNDNPESTADAVGIEVKVW